MENPQLYKYDRMPVRLSPVVPKPFILEPSEERRKSIWRRIWANRRQFKRLNHKAAS